MFFEGICVGWFDVCLVLIVVCYGWVGVVFGWIFFCVGVGDVGNWVCFFSGDGVGFVFESYVWVWLLVLDEFVVVGVVESVGDGGLCGVNGLC